MSDLFDLQLEETCIFCDNQSCVKLFENLMFHDKLKHIEINYHYIRDMVQRELSEAPVCGDEQANSQCFDQASGESEV